MNWIYELNIPTLKKSKKYSGTVEALNDAIEKYGIDYLFKTIFPSISSSSSSLLAFLAIIESELLAAMIETQAIDDKIVQSLISVAVHLHDHLLRGTNRKKLIFALKIFNKIMVRLPKEAKKTAGICKNILIKA